MGVRRTQGQLLLIRSPYQNHDHRVVSRAVLARAVQDRDFDPCDHEFTGWTDLIRFVKASVLEHSKQQGRSLDGTAGDELIALAPRILIERLIDKVESELLPANQLVAAQAVLESILLRSPLLKSAPEVLERVQQLSLTAKEKQKARQKQREHMLNDNTGYKNLERSGKLERSRRIAESIRDQETMFS